MVRCWGFALILILVLAASPALASFSLHLDSADPATISSLDQEVTVHLSLTDLPNPSYFRVAFQKSSGGAYFGYMKNNAGEWIKILPLSADCHNYFYQSDASASAIMLTLKVGSDNPIESGTYNLNAHRLTSSACSSTAADNPLPIQLSLPLPTATTAPAPTFTPTPKPTATSIPTPKIPTSTKIPSSPTSRPTAASTPSPKLSPSSTPSTFPAEVLGIEVSLAPSPDQSPTSLPSPSPIPSNQPTTGFPWFSVLLVGLGLIMLSASAAIYLHSRSS